MSVFWKDTIERVARTVIQVAAGAVLAVWIDAGSFAAIDWSIVWQAAVYAGGLAFLMALAGKQIGGNSDSPSVLSSPKD